MRNLLLIFTLCAISLPIWSQTLFSETFDEPDGVTSGMSAEGIGWTSSCATCNGANQTYNTDGTFGFQSTNASGPGVWISNNINISTCTGINFSMDFSTIGSDVPAWTGNGNLESNTECNSFGQCAGDPNTPLSPSCNICWDFMFVELLFNGAVVYSYMIGTTNVPETYTFTYNSACFPPGTYANAVIRVTTQTWADDEYLSFGNVMLSCSGNPIPAINDIADVPICAPDANPYSYTLPAITGTNLTGTQAYYTGTNGTGSSYLPGSSISLSSATTTLYMYDNVAATGCRDEESLTITKIVRPNITAPAMAVTGCGSYTLPAIATNPAAGYTTAYYTGMNQTGIMYSPGQVITSPPNTVTLYKYAFSPTMPSCFDEEIITINIIPRPVLNDIPDVTVCGGYTLPPLTGTNLQAFPYTGYFQFQNGTGTNYPVGSTIAATQTVYLYAVNPGAITPFPPFAQCPTNYDTESVNITVLPVALPPSVTSPINYCVGGIATPLAATTSGGNTLNWWGTDAVGGVSSATAPTPSTAVFGSTNYYVSQGSGACESPRAAIVVNVNPAPTPPDVISDGVCGPGLVNLSTSGCAGGTVEWYANQTTSSLLASGNNYSPSINSTTTYYVACNIAGCSSTRVPVAATVFPIPPTPTLTVDANPVCPGTPVTFTATGGANCYEFYVNGTVVQSSSPDNTYGPVTLAAGQVVTVKSFNCVIYDGNIIENAWGTGPLEDNNLSVAPDAFGTNAIVNAIYASGTTDSIQIAIAGRVTNTYRILLFIDSKPGGYNVANFGNYTPAGPGPIAYDNFNNGSVFDSYFNADYCLALGTNPGEADYFIDLMTLDAPLSPKNYLGNNNTPANPIGVIPASGTGDLTHGFEVGFLKSLIGYTGGDLKFFAMAMADNGTLGNSFLSPALSGTNYGNGAIFFANADPNPIIVPADALIPCMSNPSNSITMIVTPPPVPTFTQIPAICNGATPIPTLPSASNNAINGTWSPATVSNTVSGTYTFTPTAGQCASTASMAIMVNPLPTINVVAACAGGANSGTITTTAAASNGGTLSYTINAVADADGNQTGLANNNYTVVVTENPGGCSNSQTVAINCSCPTITVSGASTLCQTAAATTYTQVGGAAGGVWSVTPVGAGTITAVGSFTPNAAFTGAATITYTITGCVGSLNITINAQTTPIFTPIPAICSGATPIPTLPAASNNGINGTWSPATVSNTASGTYTFTPTAGQCASTASMAIMVNPLPTINVVAACAGGANSGTITTTAAASNGGTLSYTINAIADADGNQTGLANNNYTVVVTENPGGCSNSQTVAINCSCPTITVSGASTLCQTAAATTYTQVGGAAGGVWSVTPVGAGTITAVGSFTPNTAFTGAATITYTITGCVGSLNITINAQTTPIFTPIPAICSGATPIPTLPAASNNGINGTWSPATLSNTASGTYTFTPTSGQCAATTTMAITVNAATIPTFTQIPAICNGATPIPTLLAASNNAINGTWSPATVSNTASGTYTFTPTAGQCASTASMAIMVNPLPTINVVAACAGGANSGTITTTAAASNGGTLSYTINAIADADGNQTGLANNNYTVVVTENPGGCSNSQTVAINCSCPTITVSGASTLCQTAAATTYTQVGGAAGGVWSVTPVGAGTITAVGSFTPNAAFTGAATITYTITGCVGSLNITINAQTTPIFTPIPAICSGATPIPTLPAASNNGINGTWSPATLSNTASGTYTFTPTSGQCATTATMAITVNALPTINVVAACAGGANSGTITTTATASNGGTLSYTINTVADTDGNQTALANNNYTVVVTENPGGCSNSQTVTINCNCPTITVSGATTLCQTAAATTYTQVGGAAGGVWSVTPVGAGTITAAGSFTPNAAFTGAATITYTVTGCVGSLNITINAQTTPIFTPIPSICNGATQIPTLPAASNNAINGTWSPVTVSNTASGTYTFTPTSGQCASTASMAITVNALPTINVVAACAGGANSGTITTTAAASNGGTLSYTINAVADADGNQTGLANNNYTVVVTENPGACSNSQTVTINCNCPTITVSGATTLCQTAAATTYTQVGGAAGGVWSVTPVGAGTITAVGSFTPNAAFSGAATITYTVTGCVGSLNITINAQTTPIFTPIPAICSGATPIPTLPAASNNAVNGTWSPATVSNTASSTYTFTPTSGQCATTATMTITVNALPTINVVAACAGGANSGTITTTAAASNGGTLSYTINTVADADGNQTALANNNYTVVVTENPGACSNSQTVTINCNCPTITVSGASTLCQTAAATTYTQVGGAVGGVWSVTPVGAGTITAAGSFTPNAAFSGAATITYTVTGCVGSLNITINAQTTPIFTPIPAICSGATPIPTLPAASNNAINGTWSPVTVSNTASGTYTFTPTAGQCAATATMAITVNPLPTINVVGACAGGANSGTITTTATASNGGTLSYTINTIADADGNQTALANNNYTVVVTENPGGCSNSQTVTINCNCPTITVSGATTLCQTAAATTYTQAGGAVGGVWSVTPVGAGTITAAGSFTPNAAFTGAATITYTVTGCVGSLNITINAQTTPAFTQIPAICSGATPIPTLPAASNNAVNGTWSPATVSNTASGTYTFTPTAGQCATTATIAITVNALPTINVVAACAGGANSGTITTTAAASNGGTLSYTINTIADADGNQTALTNNNYTVVVTENPGGCSNSQTVTINCNCPTITVSGATTLCQTAAATTYTQVGGAAGGVWSVTPVGAGTITAAGNFTPNAAFSGAATITYTVTGCVGSLNITINAQTTPAFTQIPAICSGATPIPTLPAASNNAVNGTWSPATVSNTASGTYTFTPTAGQCAATATMAITVNALPTINVVAACAGGANSGTITTTATASNGGTLSYTINTVADTDGNQTALANNNYTVVVTENPGGCSNSQTVTINCNCPTITVSGATTLCQTAAATTYTQVGGAVGGVWSVTPVGAGTITAAGSFTPNAAFSGAATITYTITGCVGSLNITINAQTTPTFTQIPAICSGATPIPTLPAASNNAINGTWSPATVSNTASGTYTFTPTAGQCAATATMAITVNPLPTINVVGACAGGANSGTITTTATASNGGTLSYTINTIADADGNQTALANNNYTVVVTENPGACSNSQTVTINCNCPTITVSGASTLCQTAAATTYTQVGGAVGGVWSVTPVGAGTITAAGSFTPNAAFTGAATITYTITGCVGSLNITINAQTMPTFTPILAICSGTTPIPTLPAASNNAVNGTWSPATVSNTASGTYTFTPTSGQCATTATMTITVNALPTINVVAACAGGANSGTITTTAAASNGGTLSYTINTIADADGNQTALADNSYTVVVSESPSGCSISQTVTLNCGCSNPATANAGTNQTVCITDIVTLIGSIGGGASSSTWTTNGTGSFQNPNGAQTTYNPSPADLLLGTLILTLTTNDPDGVNTACAAATSTVVITFTTNCILIVSAIAKDVTCYNLTDGKLYVQATQGSFPVNYTIVRNGQNITSGILTSSAEIDTINGLASGTYTVTYTTGAVVKIVNITINNQPPPTLDLDISDYGGGFEVSCVTAADGNINLSYTGFIQPVTVNWSNGTTGIALNNLSAGTYEAIVIDANNCRDSITTILTAPDSLKLEYAVEQPDCKDARGVAYFYNLQGGISPYQLSLNGVLTSQTEFIYLNTPGAYDYRLEDDGGCIVEGGFVIVPYFPNQLSIINDTTIILGDSIALAYDIADIGRVDTIWWSPKICDSICINPVIRPFESQTYTLYVQDTVGCVESISVIIEVDRTPMIYLPEIFAPESSGGNINWIIGFGPVVAEINDVRIFDRWGNMTRQMQGSFTGNELIVWDGTFNGKKVNPGVFVYDVQGKFVDGRKFRYKGDITVVR